jgi:ubiquinone/menaquinone biosynthesis C-methylase UbiE
VKVTYRLIGQKYLKKTTELWYWQLKKQREGQFSNHHYEQYYTTYFGLSLDFYKDKKVLDIGCGPRGSLEWATMAKECVGIDPLAEKYLKMGANAQKMRYVQGEAEAMPFENDYFDVVASFNSLDHVDNVQRAIEELVRVLKKDGLFLFIADIHEQPTVTEPSAFSWDIMKTLSNYFFILEEKHYEGHQLYTSIRKGIAFDHNNPKKRYGVLTAKMCKK